ncbi:MAG: hypothetical protein ABSG73_00355 [Candidatus Aminicenantales bacterium]|jgi:hypothetical protein
MKKELKVEQPGAPPMTVEKLRKFLQSRDMTDRVAQDAKRPAGPLHGMRSGTTLSHEAELVEQATPAEIAGLAAIVAKRLAKVKTAWMKCDNRGCDVAAPFRAEHAGAACPKCNWARRVSGGHLKLLTPAEIERFLAEKSVKDAAERKRSELAWLERRNAERSKAGLPLLTLEQFRAENQANFQAQTDRERQLRDLLDKSLEIRAAKLKEAGGE